MRDAEEEEEEEEEEGSVHDKDNCGNGCEARLLGDMRIANSNSSTAASVTTISAFDSRTVSLLNVNQLNGIVATVRATVFLALKEELQAFKAYCVVSELSLCKPRAAMRKTGVGPSTSYSASAAT